MSTASEEHETLRLGPTLDLLRGLWRLNHAIERVSKRMESVLGVTTQQRQIIRCVGKYPGLTAGSLASLLHLDAGTVSTALTRLEQRGLLRRRRDQRDRRRVVLGLTPAGRALDVPAEGTVEHCVERIVATGSAEDLEGTRRILGSLTRALEETAERLRLPG